MACSYLANCGTAEAKGPVSCNRWYCGVSRPDWEALIQRQISLKPECECNLDIAINEALKNLGCGARFRPYSRGNSMVLEVIDKSVEGTTTIYAIRAAIPPSPLAGEIQKVRRQLAGASKSIDPKTLYASIPVIFQKTHLIPGLPIPAVGRFPINEALNENWPEIAEQIWYQMAWEIAKTAPHQLMEILAMCNQRIKTPGHTVPTIYSAPFVRAPFSVPQAPPPPPPPPRRQLYPISAAAGPIPNGPDSVWAVSGLGEDICEC